MDGIDLSCVPRSLVRQRCFIAVPQDAVILGQASLRFNLDPFGSFSDETIAGSLRKSRLESHFNRASSNNVGVSDEDQSTLLTNYLDTPVTSLPPMSTGQSQLFSLARAILHAQAINNELPSLPPRSITKPILLLDEATSSLDPETESAIRDIIHHEFTEKGHTIITITHRLSGLAQDMRLEQDKIALLSNGRLEKMGGVDDVWDSDIHN